MTPHAARRPSTRLSRVGGAASARSVALAALAAILALIIVVPVVDVFSTSMADGGRGYGDVLGNRAFRAVVVDTVSIAVTVTAITLALGGWIAYFMWTHAGWLRTTCVAVLVVGFFTGILVKNFVWAVLLEDNGVVNDLLRAVGLVQDPVPILFHRTAVIVGMTHYLLPIMVFPIFAGLLRIDPRVLLASRSLGASRLQTFRLVTVPMIRSGLTTGIVATFILALGFYVTPAMLGGRGDQMVANLIDNAINERTDFTSAAVLAMLVAFVVLALMPFALRDLRGAAPRQAARAAAAEESS